MKHLSIAITVLGFVFLLCLWSWPAATLAFLVGVVLETLKVLFAIALLGAAIFYGGRAAYRAIMKALIDGPPSRI